MVDPVGITEYKVAVEAPRRDGELPSDRPGKADRRVVTQDQIKRADRHRGGAPVRPRQGWRCAPPRDARLRP
jgi:hypothetical protein